MGRPANRRERPSSGQVATHGAFTDHLQRLLGPEAEPLERALGTSSPVSIRINPLKWTGPQEAPVPWCATGRYLNERPAFTFDPLLHAGCYYVQEASSMLLERAFMVTGLKDMDICALDLCAAPGGKTTHLRSLLSPDSLLVANEIDRKRLSILEENLWKWGTPDMVITGSAPRDLESLTELFDLVLVDAPCSGEGMFRKDPFARAQWSPELVEQCSVVQANALQHAYDSLRPGGWLIYSTCTWQPAENEEQVARLVAQGAVPHVIPTLPEWGVVADERSGIPSLRCYPHRVRGEGFFLALVQKPGPCSAGGSLPPTPRKKTIADDNLTWLLRGEQMQVIEHHDAYFAAPLAWTGTMDRISRALKVRCPGIPLAEVKGNDLRPHPALALCTGLDKSRFPVVELDLAQTLELLRGQALPATGASGTALATYGAVPIGWLQGAGNRWNNRWPAAWRIRSRHPSAPSVSWAHTTEQVSLP